MMRDKEKKFYGEKQKMEDIYKRKVDEESKNAYKQAQKEVREIEEHIEQKNIVLFQELNSQQKAIHALKANKARIHANHSSTNRDYQLDQDELNEYDHLYHKNLQKIHVLKNQLNYIRHFISGVLFFIIISLLLLYYYYFIIILLSIIIISS